MVFIITTINDGATFLPRFFRAANVCLVINIFIYLDEQTEYVFVHLDEQTEYVFVHLDEQTEYVFVYKHILCIPIHTDRVRLLYLSL